VKKLTKPTRGQDLRLYVILDHTGSVLRDPANPRDKWYFSELMVAKANKPSITHTIGYGPDHHKGGNT